MATEITPGKPVNMPGVYRHEASGKEVIVLPDVVGDSLITAQADALVHMGFVKIAEAPSRVELAQMQTDQAAADAKAEAAGEAPKPYPIPGEQPVVYNGTVEDTGGPASPDVAEEVATEEEAKAEEATETATEKSDENQSKAEGK